MIMGGQWVAGHSGRLYQLRDNIPDHRSCQENLAEVLERYGLTGDDIMDVFNVFMNGEIDAEGYYNVKAPAARAGDYIDLLADGPSGGYVSVSK